MIIQIQSHEDKVNNLGKLVKLQNSFSEAQDEDITNLKQAVKNINHRIEDILGLIGHAPSSQDVLSPHNNEQKGDLIEVKLLN